MRIIANIKKSIYPTIIARAPENNNLQELIFETEHLMRSISGLFKSAEKEDFGIKRVSSISRSLDQLFAEIIMAGWIIGGFLIFLGGLGTANIIFVSVKEKTYIVIIQKALGVKNHFILSEFLFKSFILELMWGALGIILIYAGSLIASNLVDFKFELTFGNIFLELFIPALIGIISGFALARSAAKLNPGDTIKTAF